MGNTPAMANGADLLPSEPEPSPDYADLKPRLNPTGRALDMPVPLFDGEQKLGELIARIETDDSIWVRADMLSDMLGEAVKPEVAAAIRKLKKKAGLINITQISSAGADLKFDQSQVALRIEPRADVRSVKEINLGNIRKVARSSTIARPAAVAGYFNFIGGVDHLWASEVADAETGVHVDVEAVVRVGSVVFEAEAAYDGAVDTETCPKDAYCDYVHQSGLKRQRTRLVYDMPERAIRVQAGDTYTQPIGLQRLTDIMGVAIARSPEILKPNSLRATTNHTFVVQRPSEVTISVNGVIARRLRLRPGNYDLTDLALVTGTNEVEVVLVDDTGAQETLNFSTFYDHKLLAAGDVRWSFGVGLPSYYKNRERRYLRDQLAGSGYYRYGLTDRVTADVNFQADETAQMGGAGFLFGTPWGLLGLSGAVSYGDDAWGQAVTFHWDGVQPKGVLTDWLGDRANFRFQAEYLSDDFRVPGEYLSYVSGLVYPQFDYWLRLSASYSFPMDYGISATLSARYQFSKDNEDDLGPYHFRGDRYGADLTLSGRVTELVSGSLTLGYSNETYLNTFNFGRDAVDPEFRVGLRAFVRLGDGKHITGSHDGLNRHSIVSGYMSHGHGVGRWETTVDAYNADRSLEGDVGGTIAYYGNRAEVRVAHNTGLSDLSWSDLEGEFGQQRSSVRVGTSVAFADGIVAVGAPIRSDAFAIVYPHASLAGKRIEVGEKRDVTAVVDGWGPAVVTTVPAYSPMTLPIDVDDLPIGYSLGTGSFDLNAPYGGGYALQVGSGFSVSVFGTLIGPDGEPLSLLGGSAYPAEDKARQVVVLTNSTGRFAAEGLAPGAWVIEMPFESGVVRYALAVPEETSGLLRAGTLKPIGVFAEVEEPGDTEARDRAPIGPDLAASGWTTNVIE